MSIYRYTLSDYHAIKEADITIDGITVLAGENGCGKSTLSRWLYYLVNGAQRFEELRIELYVSDVAQKIAEQSLAVRELRYNISKEVKIDNEIAFARPKLITSSSLNISEDPNIKQIQEKYEDFIYNTGALIVAYLEYSPTPDAKGRRILKSLNADFKVENFDNPKLVAQNYIDSCMKWLTHQTNHLYEDLEHRPLKEFFYNTLVEYDEHDEKPTHLQLREDGVDLIGEDRVSSLFNLRRAIYIDTPMALTSKSGRNLFWIELRALMTSRPNCKLEIPEKKLLRRITNILHGEAKMVKDDSPFADDELRFVSNDGRVNIEIEKVATGFKTFIYLQRLLENGCLGDDCLLLIDEPEAHLHPQWIVEYARILVLLNKDLGQKIMLATHNPDMVAAIRSIAEKEQVLDKTNFYIAEPSGQSNTYCYKALGTDISEIFTSFNIALDRIQAYGTDSL